MTEAVTAPPTPEHDDRALLHAATRGDQEAFRQLYQRHVRPVYWLAHTLLRQAADAEDLTQEVFFIAWNKRGQINIVGISLLPWLLTTCRLQAMNRIRLAQRRATDIDQFAVEAAVHTGLDTESQVEQRAVMAAIDGIVAQLAPLDQEIYRACLLEGHTYEAAAKALGVSQGAVRNRLARIRVRLRAGISGDQPLAGAKGTK